jgi:hypothetical protein
MSKAHAIEPDQPTKHVTNSALLINPSSIHHKLDPIQTFCLTRTIASAFATASQPCLVEHVLWGSRRLLEQCGQNEARILENGLSPCANELVCVSSRTAHAARSPAGSTGPASAERWKQAGMEPQPAAQHTN